MQFATTATRRGVQWLRSRWCGSRGRYRAALRLSYLEHRRSATKSPAPLLCHWTLCSRARRHTNRAIRRPGGKGTGNAPPIGTSSNGFSVAIDSGIAPHLTFRWARIRAFQDFVSGARVPIDTCAATAPTSPALTPAAANTLTASMPASRLRSTSWRPGTRRHRSQHQRRDRRARMGRAQSRDSQDQGRQYFARSRCLDRLHRPLVQAVERLRARLRLSPRLQPG